MRIHLLGGIGSWWERWFVKFITVCRGRWSWNCSRRVAIDHLKVQRVVVRSVLSLTCKRSAIMVSCGLMLGSVTHLL